jgi:hypothetical protein
LHGFRASPSRALDGQFRQSAASAAQAEGNIGDNKLRRQGLRRALPASLRTPAGSPVKSSSLPRASFTPWLSVVLAVALFSNGLFCYDQGVISCALASISSAFTLSPLIVEVVTSWVLLGALLGALAVGERANGIGRKRSVLTAGILFTLGAAVRALALETMIQDIRE